MGNTSTKTTNSTVYGDTTTANPYVTSRTNNRGTTTNYNVGTAFDTINSFVNNNMEALLEQYLNPSLNTATNKSKMNSFVNALNSESTKNLENNIINPLSQRNMVRSSQASDLYNQLAQTNASSIANYANELLGSTQKDTASVLNNLLTAYLSGYNILSDAQKQSLKASQGNATTTKTTSGSGSDLDTNYLMNFVLLTALNNVGL